MAHSAVARDVVSSLRQQIAKIEGRLPERLEMPADGPSGGVMLRTAGVAGIAAGGVIATGAPGFDAALDGGVPVAALTEIHGRGMRDAGAATGFCLALASLALAAGPRRLLAWIGLSDTFAEAGFPYAPGFWQAFGLGPDALLFCETGKLADALWVAEEVTRLDEPGAVLLELRGNPRMLDLTATRRLHRRAMEAGRPFLLLRHSAQAEPTAAPVRLVVASAPAGLRPTFAGALAGSIGPPAFAVDVAKSRGARSGRFELEWNAHDRKLWQRRPEDPGALVPLSRHGADLAPAARPRLALRSG